MPFVPLTDAERRAMLERIGVRSVDDLFTLIPEPLRYPTIDLPPGEPELAAARAVQQLAARNRPASALACFLGAGVYHHYIPSAVGALASRGEFLTSYTPYQAEVSQGTLQVTFEFQSLVCELFAMEVANAGMYDGATALAEAVLMAERITHRSRVVLAGSVHPEYRAVVETYVAPRGTELVVGAVERGDTALHEQDVGDLLDERTACCVVQQPTFFGTIHDWRALRAACDRTGALLVMVCNPIALGLLRPPGDWGADIAVGEGQPLGIAMSYGGPWIGLMATRERYVRQLPGRLVGATRDVRGRRGYVLTLQAREQHIRREKATSNICTSEALLALQAAIYLSLLGPRGLRQVAESCYQYAHYAAAAIAQLPGYAVLTPEPFFHEFVVRCPVPPSELNRQLLAAGILGGLPLGRFYPALADCMLLCCTEMNTREEIDRLVAALAAARRETA
ncbi:MAG TPA: aminomethyl-transferring glycine dehydrogenase subunit GcvPA [Chloroflexota bacterium]|nr:aminomethyl-transferring glycine dehydrogenase subunit GcvPA [Chloroflexota bacterium]